MIGQNLQAMVQVISFNDLAFLYEPCVHVNIMHVNSLCTFYVGL